MRKLLALIVVAAVPASLGVASATADDASVQAAKTRTVRVGDNFFSPKTITVKKRTIVKWAWGTDGRTSTDVEHNVRGYKGNKFRSAYKTEGTFRKRITKTTRILCDVHATTMRMTIKVKK
jgi:plastocyanin